MENITELQSLLNSGAPSFPGAFRNAVQKSVSFDSLFSLCVLKKRAEKMKVDLGSAKKLKVALLAGISAQPLADLLKITLWSKGFEAEFFLGDFDSYASEIRDPESQLYRFQPELIFLIPSPRTAKYTGRIHDARSIQEQALAAAADELLELCKTANARSKAPILFANFLPSPHFDLGAIRGKVVGSDWAFLRGLNSRFALAAPNYIHVCDLEFLASRFGLVNAMDPRAWYESRQLGSPDFLAQVAHEFAHMAQSLWKSPKKVMVVDLDNSLWGGVIGDDGLKGIEIGPPSARGEAFRDFQKYLFALKDRGVLLAVCSKNDPVRALEPFEKHPEMALKKADFVAFYANWEPKSENLRAIAASLGLGLDSLVFADDNPAEIELVRQFTPEVATLLLGENPAGFIGIVKDSRLFEPLSITSEDAARTQQYKMRSEFQRATASPLDMESYLESLEMKAEIQEFNELDIARIAQLINKSNQFNLTTIRRTEAEILAMAKDAKFACFSLRLSDKFGDHGLVSVVILEKSGEECRIDTWVMSCRVLKRQVEQEVLNYILLKAKELNCRLIVGNFIPTEKNEIVKSLYPEMGFSSVQKTTNGEQFHLALASARPTATKIKTLVKA